MSESEDHGYYIRAKVGNKWGSHLVPFHTAENGKLYLDSQDTMRMPELEDFIKKYDKCFNYAINEDRWYFDPKVEAEE